MHHSFDISSAAKYGVIEAILYENILHWLRVNKANGANINDGKVWTYNSVQAYSRLFPYLTPKQIRRAIASLVEQKAIVKGDYNKANYDKTSWYSIPDESILAIGPEGQAISPKGQMDVPEKANRSAQKGEPIPDINTDIKPDVNTDTAREITEHLAEPFRLYNQHIRPASIVQLDYQIRRAISMTSVEIVRDAILQVVGERLSNPPREKRYLPHMGSLLYDSDKLIGRAADYKPENPLPEWMRDGDEERIISTVARIIKHRGEVPKEAEKWIPQAQQRLNERLAG